MRTVINYEGMVLRKLSTPERRRCGCDCCVDAYDYESMEGVYHYRRRIVKTTDTNNQFGKFCKYAECPYFGRKGVYKDERIETDDI